MTGRYVAAASLAVTLSACGNGASEAGPLDVVSPTSTDRRTAAGSVSPAGSALPTGPTGVCEQTWDARSDFTRVDGTTPTSRQREHVPADFKPVLLITCTMDVRETPADGRWIYSIEQHATEGLDDVVAAVRVTPPPASDEGGGCTADLRMDPWFLLYDASGRSVLPVVPHDNDCDKPVDVGLDRLKLVDVKATKVKQDASPAMIATGCSASWKNEPVMLAAEGRDATTGYTPAADPTHVCVYRRGEQAEVGTFSGGAKLTPAGGDRLRRLMSAGPGEPRGCRPAADFAVVHAGGDWVYVELSGCQRLIAGGGTAYHSAVPRLVDAVKALELQR